MEAAGKRIASTTNRCLHTKQRKLKNALNDARVLKLPDKMLKEVS